MLTSFHYYYLASFSSFSYFYCISCAILIDYVALLGINEGRVNELLRLRCCIASI